MKMLSVNQLAEHLGISRSTLYRLISDGEFKPVRVGTRLRFEPCDVQDYLNRNRATTNGNETNSDANIHTTMQNPQPHHQEAK